jgi:hypothetical protein
MTREEARIIAQIAYTDLMELFSDWEKDELFEDLVLHWDKCFTVDGHFFREEDLQD